MTIRQSNDGRKKSKLTLPRRKILKVTGAGIGVGVSVLNPGINVTSVRAVSTSLIDDFEDGDISEYSGEVGKYTVQSSTVLEGNYSLKATDPYGKIANSSTKGQTTRGNEYVAQVLAPSGSDGYPGLLVGSQDPDYPGSDCYMSILQPAKDQLLLLRRDSGSNTVLDSVSVSLSEGTEYRLAMRYATERIQVSVQDKNGNKIGGTDAIKDTTYSGGYFGFYTGNSTPVYYDYIETAPLTSTFRDEHIFEPIEYFKDEDLSPYSFDRGESGASIVHGSDYTGTNGFGGSYAGEKALKISGSNTEMISTSGLDNYPAAGDTFSCYFMAVDPADQLNVTWGVQDHNNRYFIHVDYIDQEILLCKYKNETTYVLDSTSNVPLEYDTWYYAEVEWFDDGFMDAYIYDVHRNEIGEAAGTDTEWKAGGIGYDAYLGSGGDVYFDYFNVGKHSEYKGEWGPVVEDGGEVLDAGDSYDYIYDLKYWLAFNGVGDVTYNGKEYWEYTFVMGAMTNTYRREESFSSDPHPSKLDPLNEVGYHRDTIEVTNPSSSHDYLTHNPDTDEAGYLTKTEWTDETANNWDQPVSADEYKTITIKNHDKEFFDWDLTTTGGSLGLAGWAIRKGWTTTAVGSILIGSYEFINHVHDSSYTCERDYSEGNTKETQIWDFCTEHPVTGHEIEYAIKVPKGESVDVKITQEIEPGTNLQAGDQTAEWNQHLPGDGSKPPAPTHDSY